MKEEQNILTDTSFPRLALKARVQIDKVTGQPILLYPEGVLLLNETGAAIVRLCDGSRSLLQIVEELSLQYRQSPAQIQPEIARYLVLLYRHSLLEIESSEFPSFH
ncbi:pyrroloquinoline quinone biosynthesis peptide chaperone PqqD [Tengunoibacter tsumagoiensis]|uniref:Coenzyme PQQ synthesis protein D n=1 Tax=Tengunoibacter tsumagoiensis TaxID=2014871 RepID=A0A402A2H2_9CHLR|nr:pyrroloquinoline quinone biosynthesis peptide chaperone PqqD [Tengunoibacter tsumagoiensis]GCE13255.1 hypothetical protein KTT_31140 [Tengunoibacter tsumagoiensis]